MRPYTANFILFILFAVAASLHSTVHARELDNSELVLVGSNDTKNSISGRWLSLIYSEVAKRMNRKLIYRGYPAKRASLLSDAGIVHGEIHRVGSYADLHPNMIRVEEPHFSIQFSAYTHSKTLQLNSWSSLSNNDLTVGYRSGVKRSKAQLEKLTLTELTAVPDNKTGISMLSRHRYDVYVDVKENLENTIEANPHIKNIYPAGVIEKLQTYAYLHKKYRHLAPKIAATLQQLKKEGLIEKFKKLSAVSSN